LYTSPITLGEMPVDPSRIQGFGSTPAIPPESEVNIVSDDILSLISAAFGQASQTLNEMTRDIDLDLERIKAMFNCQAPGQETLNAEQIVVEHAISQVRSTLTCQAPDSSQLTRDEIEVDTSSVAQSQSLPHEEVQPDQDEAMIAADAVSKDPANLLDLSDPLPTQEQPKCVSSVEVQSRIEVNEEAQADRDMPANGLGKELVNLLDLSCPAVDQEQCTQSESGALNKQSAESSQFSDLPSPGRARTLAREDVLSSKEEQIMLAGILSKERVNLMELFDSLPSQRQPAATEGGNLESGFPTSSDLLDLSNPISVQGELLPLKRRTFDAQATDLLDLSGSAPASDMNATVVPQTDAVCDLVGTFETQIPPAISDAALHGVSAQDAV